MGTDTYKNVDQSLGHNYIGSWTSNGWSHGTNVAGIIAAKTNNGKGVAGIAGGNNSQGVTVIPYCIGDENGCHTTFMDDAIEDAVSKGAKIINMSFGDANILPFYVYQAIMSAYNNGVTLVASSGKYVGNTVFYPAKYDIVIAVGGIIGNYRDSNANYGTGLDFVAPSTNIYTTDSLNTYSNFSGTSASAPEVTGVIALMLSVNPSLTPSEIKDILKNTATKLSTYTYDSNGWNQEVGYGLINAYDAVICSLPIYISGFTLICNQGLFPITNIPFGSSVALNTNYSSSGFSVIGSPNISITYSGGTIYVQKVTDGMGYLKVYYKGILLDTMDFWVGVPIINDVYYTGGHIYIEADTESAPDPRLFYVVINGVRYRILGGMGSLPLPNGTYNVEAYVSNECGESDHYFTQIVITGNYMYSLVNISSTHQVTIEAKDYGDAPLPLEISMMGRELSSTVPYSLKNVQTGEVMTKGEMPIGGGVLDFSNMQKGLYLLEITSQSGDTETFKVQFK
jgi:hypothetical protein